MSTIVAKSFADIRRQSADLGFTVDEKDICESTQTRGYGVYGIDLGKGKDYSKILNVCPRCGGMIWYIKGQGSLCQESDCGVHIP